MAVTTTYTAAVVTISDSSFTGSRVDESGPRVCELLESSGFSVAATEVVPDERAVISDVLRRLCTDPSVRCIVTTGGTGLGPRDVTPEATREVIDREIPGMAEAMRMKGLSGTPFAMLSRQVVGAAGSTLIVNLPGSVKGANECLQVVLPVLKHAVDLLAGDTKHG